MSDEKWQPFNCFSVQRTGGSPTGPDPENRVGDQDTGSQNRPVSWIAPKKFQNLLRLLAPLTFLIRVQAFRDPLGGELPHVKIFMNDGSNPLT